MNTQEIINTLFEQSATLYEMACRLEKAHREPEPVVICGRHLDAITPNVPEGYDTILGYLAKHHPDILDTFDYSDPVMTVRDGYKLAHWAKQAGARHHYVPAPPCLSHTEIEYVRAYPVSLLQQRWG